MTKKKNGRLAAPVELISPWLPNSNRAQYSATCESCGIGFPARSRLHRLCWTCWRWTLGARHLHAAHALLGGAR